MLDLRQPLMTSGATAASMLSLLGMESAPATSGVVSDVSRSSIHSSGGRSNGNSNNNSFSNNSTISYYANVKSPGSATSSPSPSSAGGESVHERSSEKTSRSSPDHKCNSPVLHYASSPELAAAPSFTLQQQQQQLNHHQMYQQHPGLVLPAFHSALQMQSLQQSLRNLHGLQALQPFGGKLQAPPPPALLAPSPSSTAKSPDFAPKETPTGSPVSATPHGIEHILSRPPVRIVGSGGGACSTAPTSPAVHHATFSAMSQQTAPMNLAAAGLALPAPSLTSVYWPTLPGFMGNPALQAWRDRLYSGKFPIQTHKHKITYNLHISYHTFIIYW